MDWYEIVGFITGVLCVALQIKRNIWNWPLAIVNGIFYIIVFYGAKLYADVGLQVFFITISVYGWVEWLHGKPGGEIEVRRLTAVEIGLSMVLIGGGTYVLGSLLHYTTDAAMPYADSLAATMSLTAQLLMARKKLENWILWIAVNILYIGVYFYRGLFLTQFLYGIYLVLATMGYLEWKKSYRMMISTAAPVRGAAE